jgi:hypothetical protein
MFIDNRRSAGLAVLSFICVIASSGEMAEMWAVV